MPTLLQHAVGVGVSTMALDFALPGVGSAVAVLWTMATILSSDGSQQPRPPEDTMKKIQEWVERYVRVALDEKHMRDANMEVAQLYNNIAGYKEKCHVETSAACCLESRPSPYCNSTSPSQKNAPIEWSKLSRTDAKDRMGGLDFMYKKCEQCLRDGGSNCPVTSAALLQDPTPLLPVFVNYGTLCLGVYREMWQGAVALDDISRNVYANALVSLVDGLTKVRAWRPVCTCTVGDCGPGALQGAP